MEGNIKEAYLLYAAGADLGLVDCMMSAAWILENHPDLFPENTEKAIYQFYLMAATLNNSEA